jgi:hypothetical protein
MIMVNTIKVKATEDQYVTLMVDKIKGFFPVIQITASPMNSKVPDKGNSQIEMVDGTSFSVLDTVEDIQSYIDAHRPAQAPTPAGKRPTSQT